MNECLASAAARTHGGRNRLVEGNAEATNTGSCDRGPGHESRRAAGAAGGNTLERFFSDYGLDLQMWTFDKNGEVQSRFVAYQIKSTDNLQVVDGGHFVTVRVDRRDIRFWLSQSAPVVLVMYDALNDVGYWIDIQRHFRSLRSSNLTEFSASITVRIPITHQLNVDAIDLISSLKGLRDAD